MNLPDKEEQQRQIKIDADIDEVVKTIQGLGLKPDEEPPATGHSDENLSRKRNCWLRLVVVTLATFTIATFAGFVGAYTFNALNGAGDIRDSRSPEIRRAIPVEPEIRRAIPVEPEIRKAISTHPIPSKSRSGAGDKSQGRSLIERASHA